MPENCNDVNINGVLNILNAARRMDVEKIIYASSSSVYGDTPTLPPVIKIILLLSIFILTLSSLTSFQFLF